MDVKYFIFDIETVADGKLIQKIRYPDRPELSPEEAIYEYRQDLLEASEGQSDFIPHTFVLPVSVAIAKVGADYRLHEVVTLDRPAFRPQVIARDFWKGWRAYDMPVFVTFNGRGFDVPVMEMCAFRFGINIGEWMLTEGPSYKQPRNRYTFDYHLDLQELLGNFNSARMTGGLNLLASLLSKPGKMDTKGSMVQDLWQAGEKTRIDDYCMCDALDTYFVFLRTRVMAGDIPLSKEHELVSHAYDWIEKASAKNAALSEYLKHFSFWKAPTDNDNVLGS